MSYFEPHANRKKTLYYISYKDKEGRKYVFDDAENIISFSNPEDAKAYILSRRIENDAKNIIKKQRNLTLKRYGNHYNLLIQFLKEKSKKAKYSWERSHLNMHNYVFLYFLYMHKRGNPKTWSMHFKGFKRWLEDEATTIKKNKGKDKLSVSSRNKIIGDLNAYIKFYYQETHLSEAPIACEYFEGSEEGYRTGEDIVGDDEYAEVLKNFDIMLAEYIEAKDENNINRTLQTKELYIVCRHTGMRLSEALGISFGDFHPSPVKDKNLEKIISSHGLETIGYIVLKTQLEKSDKALGVCTRKPLKSKKTSSPDNSRIIPIFKGQEKCFDILVKQMMDAKNHYSITSTEQIKLNEGQFLFFRDINKNISSNKLITIYKWMQRTTPSLKWKSFHCLRHTRATEIVSQTHNSTLVKLILGHQSKVFERYVHLEATLSKKLSNDISLGELLDFRADNKTA